MMQGADNPAFQPDSELVKKNKTWTKHRVAQLSVSSPPSATTTITNSNSSNNNVNDVDESSELLDFDDVLPSVGEFGIYQIILFFLTAPFCFFLAFSYFSQVFITLVPDHWCRVPQLNNLTQLTLHQRWVKVVLFFFVISRINVVIVGKLLNDCHQYNVDIFLSIIKELLRNNLLPSAGTMWRCFQTITAAWRQLKVTSALFHFFSFQRSWGEFVSSWVKEKKKKLLNTNERNDSFDALFSSAWHTTRLSLARLCPLLWLRIIKAGYKVA